MDLLSPVILCRVENEVLLEQDYQQHCSSLFTSLVMKLVGTQWLYDLPVDRLEDVVTPHRRPDVLVDFTFSSGPVDGFAGSDREWVDVSQPIMVPFVRLPHISFSEDWGMVSN